MTIAGFQELMRATYGERDRARGPDATFRWLVEEVGELARAMRDGDPDRLAAEAGDVLAWLASLADQLEVDLSAAAARYASGCPRCGQHPCECATGARDRAG